MYNESINTNNKIISTDLILNIFYQCFYADFKRYKKFSKNGQILRV